MSTAARAKLNAEAIDGDINIIGSPPWVRAKSASGAVTFQGSSAGRRHSHRQWSGEGRGACFERAKLETVTGDIRFAGTFERGGAFDFDTHSGAIDIAIPSKASASFSVVSIAGKITNNLSKASPIAGRFGRGEELTVDAGTGGPKVSVRTFKGPITLRRMM